MIFLLLSIFIILEIIYTKTLNTENKQQIYIQSVYLLGILVMWCFFIIIKKTVQENLLYC